MPTSPPPALNWSRRKLRLFKLALLLSALLFALLSAEIALRIAGYTYPVFYTTDTVRGYALEPGLSGWYRKEGAAYIRINSEGLRDREHPKEKPANTLRIALLGDSYAEALQVPLEAAFWVVLEQRLQGCQAFSAGRRVEVVNFGVSGYGTAQELLTLRERVWDYAPDIVLLAVTTNNDITDNLRAFKKAEEIPYFVHRDGQLALDDSFRESRTFRLRHSAINRAGRWIRARLRVLQAFHEGHYTLKNYLASRRAPAAKAPADADAATATSTPAANIPAPVRDGANAATTNAQPPSGNEDAANVADELGIDNLIYREPADANWQEAWRVTENLLRQMRDEVRGRGAQFIVATLSNGVQVHPRPEARAAFLARVGASDIFYPDMRLKSLGEREGFPVHTLAPALQQYAEQRQTFLHGFERNLGNGHWNVEGHRAAGELLAQRICAVSGTN
ncbi:MAG TPA: SGNH/GDSL hydrolase family protein [Pyrinomonadaceae bacterium]|nr:SGNH/GDSL hydrolase family protein [Pyrinomonadaceae bacterium]